MKPIKIVIIDDHQLFREGVKQILNGEPNVHVVAEGEDGSQAMRLMKLYKPDVMIMDIEMPNMNGIEATKNLLGAYPDVKVILLSNYDDDYVMHAIKTGAYGYLLKNMDTKTLIHAIRKVAEGAAYLHPSVTNLFVKEYMRVSNHRESLITCRQFKIKPSFQLLTRRECEVFELLLEGKSNKAIGETLSICEGTVKSHMRSILHKMDVFDRLQAVVTAIKKGWIELR
ncbi:response regulator transcription factor [Halalkalibacterium halodurans]|uniref:response regulator transcription factor n=1 Tax=Halalkalibacterium halodurans TaxID=86665 RepID=UPI002AA96A28|nr:response regulator transcription factor [Halalkalibacterium halodurans]MDY7224170.1 response regulator transcription factor [Halalkalibacterium halodurans]MDY7243455.1 response regulator transcription factor [Halalkalibacterium halodurans]